MSSSISPSSASGETAETLEGVSGLTVQRLVGVVRWIVVTAAALWIVGAVLEHYTRRLDFSEPKAREALAFKGRAFDVLYFGNSLVLQGVDPSVIDSALSIKSYNMALGGSPILESEMQLRYYLRQNQKPRLVALGLYLNAAPMVGVRAQVYFGLPAGLRRLFVEKAKEIGWQETIDRSFLVFNAVPAYRYRSTFDLMVKAALSRQNQVPQFVQGQARVFFRNPVTLGPRHEGGVNERELRSFLELCDSAGTRVLLFEPPNSPGYAALATNRADVVRRAVKVAGEFPNASFKSFVDDPVSGLASQDWVNLNHLSATGAAKFSGAMARDIDAVLSHNRTVSPSTSAARVIPLSRVRPGEKLYRGRGAAELLLPKSLADDRR